MINVAVMGAQGRMGKTVVDAVNGAEDTELVAALDVGDTVADAVAAGAHVAVDFTIPSETEANVHALIDAGIHTVVGTTGWNDDSMKRVEDHLAEHNAANPGAPVGVLIAPNFALGAVLTMKMSAMAAKYFESVEVIELHHPDKVDAPSGTAAHTARGIAAARAEAGVAHSPDATEDFSNGARGVDVDGVRVHAVRLRGLVAHSEILMGNAGEQLTIRHDSFDRVSFMPGVLLGVREVAAHPGLSVGLDAYMSL